MVLEVEFWVWICVIELEWRVLGFCRKCVVVFFNCMRDISCHGNVDMTSVGVFPFHGESAIVGARPIYFYWVMFFKCGDEVICIGDGCVADSEIICA